MTIKTAPGDMLLSLLMDQFADVVPTGGGVLESACAAVTGHRY